ncbi:MAG: 16S rRNA (cytosine(967)-C(5))-methyltransferase RsmB, partial [bacterium]
HPEWLVDRWEQAWPDLLDPIIEANNARAPMTLRVNVRGGSRDDYLEALRADSIDAEPTPFAENGVQLTAPIDVEKLPGFNEGRVSVQDEAPQLAAQLLGPQPGDRVLDACCAPGGKTGHLFEIMGEGSTLHALELDGERIRRVEDNISRIMGTKGDFPSLELFQADGLDLETWWDGNTYQRILLDAPCSATGVIRRNPDIKILRRSSDISNLATLQLDLLRALWKTLAEGGTLLYATCSTLPEENDGVIAEFLNTEESAACEPMDANWGQATRFGRQLFPQINGHDGFYYARLRKS